MQPEANTQPPAEIAKAPMPASPGLERPRVTVDQLALLPESEQRRMWINSIVEADVARQTYAQDKALARDFAASGQFDDLKGMSADQAIATAMVKIQLGSAWGFNAADSMRYIYFTNGKPSVENEIVAAKLKAAGYGWDTEWLEEDIKHKGMAVKKCVGCILWLKFFSQADQHYKPVLDRNEKPVSVSFTQYDADTAQIWEKGKQIPLSQKWNFQSWARDMYYWRAISRLKKYHAPDVLRGGMSREEALDIVPVDNLAPEMPLKELQPPQPEPQPESPAKQSLKERVLERIAETPTEEPEQRTLEGVEG